MLEIITGSPGAGKTLIALQFYLLAALRRGRRVYHNIPGLDFLRIAWYVGVDPKDVEKLLFYSEVREGAKPSPSISKAFVYYDTKGVKKDEDVYKTPADFLKWIEAMPPGSLGIIDEAQNVLGARDWQQPKNVEFFEYATVHRHSGHDIVLVTQHEDNIDVSVRRINNQLVQLRRLEYLGFFFRTSVSCRYYAGYQTAACQPMYKVTRKYDKNLFRLYSSYNVQGVSEGKRTGTVWRNPKLIAMFVVFFLCLFFVPGFLERTGFIKRYSNKPVVSVSSSSAGLLYVPADYLGPFSDYFCGADYLYVLRYSGSVDTLFTKGVPVWVCPRLNYSPGGST